MLTCPNCGYKQSSGDKCQKCRSLFAYYLQTEMQGGAQPVAHKPAQTFAASAKTATDEPKPPSLWRKAYRVMNWATLAFLIIVIGLILRKSTPPPVEDDSQAAARAEMKFSQAESAIAANQPYELTLERTELNSYLRQNLEIAGNEQTQPSLANSPVSSATPGNQPPAQTQSALGAAGDPSVAEVQSAVRDVRVDLDGDLVKAYVVFDFHGKDLSLELDGHLSSADGYIQFQPVAGWLGSLPLPQSALDSAVQRLVSSPENHEKLRLPAGIQSIAVQDSHLIINYQ